MDFNNLIYSCFFYLIAFVLVVASLGVIFMPKIVYSAVSMILAFLSVAGIFVLLNADFVAISQVIIYGVGITIVMVFAIMLTGVGEDKSLRVAIKPRTLLAFASAGLFFLLVAFSITAGFSRFTQGNDIFILSEPSVQIVETLKTEGTAGIIGESLLTKYVLPFEILSLLLLAAIFGAVVITRKDGDNLVNPTTVLEENEGE